MELYGSSLILALELMQLVWVLVVGGLIGWVASMIMGTNAQMGLLMNIVVGIVGAFLGFFIAGALGIGAGDTLKNILIQLGGAVLLIFLLKALKILR
jgi:uncharacterized membrane protein YeaQ/YmgE (transglycosylase-associated protein family)